jgi:hypothetical protein
MIRERLIVLVNDTTNERTKHKDFSDLTGLKRTVVKSLLDGKQRINEEHIDAICSAFPKYKIWFVFGDVYPEIGQVSPELEKTTTEYLKTGTDTK